MTSTSLSLSFPTSFPFPTAVRARNRICWAPVGPTPSPAPLPPETTLAVSRRLLLPAALPAASAIWDFLSGGGAAASSASLAVRRGMQLFRQGDVRGSLAEFDRAIELDPRQKIYGKGGSHCITWTGLKKVQSNSGWMSQLTQMTLKSRYGAFCVKLVCME